MRYILALGSNLEDKRSFLRKGVEYLSNLGTVIMESSIYETSPVGMEDGTENFFNSIIVLEAEIDPEIMIVRIKEFEKKAGRSLVNSHMRPRELDIDIIFADNMIINTPALTIPHPRLEKRKFVLAPLAEILPEQTHPITGKTIIELLDKLNTEEEIRIVKAEGIDPA